MKKQEIQSGLQLSFTSNFLGCQRESLSKAASSRPHVHLEPWPGAIFMILLMTVLHNL